MDEKKIVKRLWWEGNDMLVETADGMVNKYVDAHMIRYTVHYEQTDVVIEDAVAVEFTRSNGKIFKT